MTLGKNTVKAFIRDEHMGSMAYAKASAKLRHSRMPMAAEEVAQMSRDEARHREFWLKFLKENW